MTRNLVNAASAAAAALFLAGAAHAAQINIAISTPESGSVVAQPVQYGGHDYDERRYIRSPWEDGDAYRHPRPAPRWGHWDRYSWARPVYGRPDWSRHDDCRTIVKKQVSPWGEVTVKRVQICDSS